MSREQASVSQGPKNAAFASRPAPHATSGTPKTLAAGSIALPGFLYRILGAHLGSMPRSGLAFPDAASGPLRVTNWNRPIFTPEATVVGLVPPRLAFTTSGTTAASLMISSGAGVKLVQHQLGHRTATLTLDAHLFPNEVDALSSALDGLRERTPADSLRTVPTVGDPRRREMPSDLSFLGGAGRT